ncbi:MAG: hypothetical protein IPH60_16430 [Flavobacteriales bacterium]|nr:hypothetical protein [Flavobacteriales bacterium]
MKVNCFVFRTRVKDNDAKQTKDNIQKRYFKNNMSVLFSMNGQVHGHFTAEFITRSLKMNMLKSHLLIHVDCTNMNYDFRKELFMASRDRMKDGEETQHLRHFLAKKLSRKGGRLWEIQEQRKSAADIDTSSSTQDLLRSFANKMPLDPELKKMLQQTFKTTSPQEKPSREEEEQQAQEPKPQEPFKAERFPTFLTYGTDRPRPRWSRSGEKVLKLKTDVENDYFDRSGDAGTLRISLLTLKPNETGGGTAPGQPKDITDIFSVNKSSPKDGTIKIALSPKPNELKVGDQAQVKVSLTALEETRKPCSG